MMMATTLAVNIHTTWLDESRQNIYSKIRKERRNKKIRDTTALYAITELCCSIMGTTIDKK